MPRRLNGEGSIKERSDGRFEAKIQIGSKPDGKPLMKSFYGKTKREAKQKLDDYLVLSQSGQKMELVTVEKYILNWLENVKKNELKPRSYDTLEYTVKTNIIDKIGYYGISDLTSDIIQKELINRMVSLNYSYSTIKKAYDAINACLMYAVANKAIVYNPMQTVAKPSRKNFKEKEIEILTDNEVECLYKAAVAYGKHGHAIILMLYTGMRVAEAIGLKWSNFNEEDNILFIRNSVVLAKNRSEKKPAYSFVEQDTLKTKSGERKIYLSAKALTAIKELRKLNYRGNQDGFMICTRNNTILYPMNMQRTLDIILSKAGISHKGLHSLRHTFASMLIRKGVDIKVVSELLGHSDVSFTYNTYVHIMDEQKKSAIKELDNL